MKQNEILCDEPDRCVFPPQLRVAGDVNDVQLTQLLPNTAYSISLFAMHGDLASEPLDDRGVTRTSVLVLMTGSDLKGVCVVLCCM